jgi:hypothetical protein
VAYLRDENRRKDEIIMQQAVTMRQITAASSQEPPESPVSPTPTNTPNRAGAEAQEGVQRPWWRRWPAKLLGDDERNEVVTQRTQRTKGLIALLATVVVLVAASLGVAYAANRYPEGKCGDPADLRP